MADVDKLISDYITTRRFAKDKIFKTGEFYLGDMARKLGVPHSQTNLEYCERIIKKLILDYNYFGEYNSSQINLFLNLYDNAHKGSIPDSIKLYDLELKIPGNNQIANILAALNRNTNHYYVTQDDNNKFKRKTYNEQLDQRVKDIEQQLQQQKLLEQQRQQELLEQQQQQEQQRQQELQEKYEYFGEYNPQYISEYLRIHNMDTTDELNRIIRENILEDIELDEYMDQHYINEEKYKMLTDPKYRNDKIAAAKEQLAKYQRSRRIPLESLRTSLDAKASRESKIPSEEEQQQQEQQINNTTNRIFPNDKMTQQAVTRSRGKIGMNELAHIVLDLQRDFKRVANALSVQGAQEIVNKHNAKSPNAPWHVTDTDVNGDNIPDIIIRNANDDPLVINGWTTKRSDYPVRLQYHTAYPTREARKAQPFAQFKKDELYQFKHDYENDDVHARGNILSYNKEAFPSGEHGWKISSYNVTLPKRHSAYRRFQELIAHPTLNLVLNKLNEEGKIPLNEQTGNWPDKMKFCAMVIAKLWDKFIINVLAERTGMDQNSKEFKKFKNSKRGKEVIDNTVTELYYHVTETNDEWTEEERADLEVRIINFAADELLKLIEHTEDLQQHYYPTPVVREHLAHNAATEGAFGERKGW